MTVVYGVVCAVSFLFIILYLGCFDRKDVWFFMTFMAFFTCNAGYFVLALSRTLEEALLANRIAYMGSVFLPFFLLFTIVRVCKYKYPKFLPFTIVFINVAVLLLTVTSGYNTLYYAEVGFEVVNGAGRLVKTYGPLHYVYYAYLLGYFGVMVGVIARAFFKRKLVSYKHAVILAAGVFINILIYFVERLLKPDFEALTVSYIITSLFLIVLCKKIEDYDINSVLQSALAAESMGVILFDAEGAFKGCNEDAAAVFPELKDLKLEYPVPEEERELQSTIMPLVASMDASEDMTYRHGYRIYKIFARPFRGKNGDGKQLGVAVVISDDTAQQEYLQLMSSYSEKLEEDVEQKTRHVLAMHDKLILGMADMVEGRDPNTGGHIKRTSAVVGIFVEKLQRAGVSGCTKEFLKKVEKAAPMHDLGKIAIDDAILRKPGKYTPGEYAIMRTHSEKGAEIVGKILRSEDDGEFYDIAVNVAHYHHERYDGKGYPAGLSGESIPVEARIMALADVFDALVSKRCYKEKYSCGKACKIIKSALGRQFDPGLGKVFLECADELAARYAVWESGVDPNGEI